MVKIICAILVAGLVGCATITFDPVEYDQWISVSYMANQAIRLCDQPEAGVGVKVLLMQVEYAKMYSSSKNHNNRIAKAASVIEELSNALGTRYETVVPSAAYCKLKITEIETAARMVAETLSKKES